MIKRISKKKNISLIKVILPSLLFLIVLFSLFSLSNNKTIINNLSKVFYGDNEVELDNWEISTVFYDSTVNDGKTPLTEINWDASDGGYSMGEPKTITVQINYKNTNTVNSYQPGELKLEIPNLFYGYVDSNKYRGEAAGLFSNVQMDVGANYSNKINYDWNFTTSSSGPTTKQPIFSFVNANIIEQNSNLEGSIQIVFTLSSAYCNGYIYNYQRLTFDNLSSHNFENHNNNFDLECTHSMNKNLVTNFYRKNGNSWESIINSSNISFNYSRTYVHEWTHSNFEIEKKAFTVGSYDGLADNAQDYYWVKYSFEITGRMHNSTNPFPYIPLNNLFVKETFPEGCIVKDASLEEIVSNNGIYTIPIGYYSESSTRTYIFVGYPKDLYSETLNNLDISNKAELYASFKNGEDIFQDDSEIFLNLSNYNVNITGNLYSFSKRFFGETISGSDNSIEYYQSLIGLDSNIGNGGVFNSQISPNIKYSGRTMDAIIGDDVLFITDENSNYRQLRGNEYYYSSISFNTAYLINANGVKIPDDKYDCELWIRREDSFSYDKYDEFTFNNKTWTFSSDDHITGYYYKIKQLKESLMYQSGAYHTPPFKSNIVINNAENIAKNGNVINYAFLRVFVDNELQNTCTSNDYVNNDTKDLIMDIDLDKYNMYMQRTFSSYNYSYFSLSKPLLDMSMNKTMDTPVQDAVNEFFSGKVSLSVKTSGDWFEPYEHSAYELEHYANTVDEEELCDGWDIYDLLPVGMELISTKEEIANSVSTDSLNTPYKAVVSSSGHKYTANEFKALLKENQTIEIIHNYQNSGRTYLHINIDLSQNPIVYRTNYSQMLLLANYSFKYRITYDSYIEYGKNWKNNVYSSFYNRPINATYPNFRITSGIKNYNIEDIYERNMVSNDQNNTYAYSQSSVMINSVISTNQDVQVSVQSNDGNFDTGKVESPNNSKYTYKLRARTGANDITNLVIYDSLEKYAKDPNMEFIDSAKGYHKWKGEFLGIDTSYAESKGYNIRTYYSESDQPGGLKEDDSWTLYTDSVDKTKVKSLAFEYLDGEGNPAVLPANSLTYVLVKMKSPSDENIKTFAYNGCWTEWNAIDSITGRPVDFITGINSNVVKVALPNSVEPTDIDLTIDKYWNDSNNKLNIRPDTTTIQVVPDGDLSKAIDVPLGTTNVDPNNSNHWKTTISVPKYDLDGNTINYTFRENEIVLDNNYKYTPEVNDNSITNTLNKEIELKKIWKDNTNSYLTRPNNVTYHIKQNNNSYKDITFTGDYSTNEWTKTITVPVFDNSNKEYTYTMEEESINNYISDCNEFTCTNTLSANDTLNIKKNWLDNNNSYNTRPNSIMINILQNNNTYRGITLTSNNNWTHTITVPKYDSNGVKYNYTIEEEQVNEYGLVEYNQSNYTVTNTLKTNINLTITKNWIDDNNSNNTRPNELKITLLQNNNEYRELTLSGDTNTWTTTIEVPKYDNNQKEYKYSIREKTDNLNSDYSDITYSEEELSVTNKLNKKQDLLIKKKWMDDDNKYLTRPSSVKVNLLRDNELFKTIELEGDSNIWSTTINDIDIYDSNGRKYNYTLEEETLEKYGKVTYNNADLEITNELTEIPKVTLYFTVVNGYIDPVTGEMKYDDFGLNEIMKKYNVDPDSEYIFEFELQNTSTNKIYNGKLSTQGILEFDDIPYGEYKAVEGKDKLFTFVDMLEIEEVHGVKFEKKGNEGYITIEPTGENIVYGAKIINKIEAPITNPKTHIKGLFLVFTIILISVFSFIIIRKKKELYN